MLADTWLLARLQLRLWWNTTRARSGPRQAFGWMLTVGVTAAILFAASSIGTVLGAAARTTDEIPLVALVPGVVLSLLFLLLLLTSFATALNALFLNEDMEVLLVAPVDRRAVFITKLVSGLGFAYAASLLGGLSLLVAFGIAAGLALPWFLGVLVVCLAAPLLPDGLGAIIVMLVARVAPANRVREAMAVVGALIGLGIAFAVQAARFQDGFSIRLERETTFALLNDVAGLPVPTFGAGRGLAALGQLELGTGLAELALYLGLTALIFGGAVWLGDRWYFSGLLRMQAGPGRRRTGSAQATPLRFTGRAPLLAITRKDWWTLPRDPRQFVQLLGPLAILPVIYFNLFAGRGQRIDPIGGFTELTGGAFDPTEAFVVMTILLATALVFGQAALIAVSSEGKSWWVLRSAPISWDALLFGKFLVSYVPFLVLSTAALLVVGVLRGWSPTGMLIGWVGIALIGTGIIAMALGMGALWARLDWDNPRQMGNTWGSFAWFAGYTVYGLLAGGALLGGATLAAIAPGIALGAWLGGIVVAVALTAAVILGSRWLALSRLPRLGEG